MPLINLIQEQRLAAKAKERNVQLGVLATMGIGAVSLLATLGLLFDATRINLQAAQLNEKIKELEPLVEELAANTAEVEKMEPRLNTLETAQADTAKWSSVLTHLTVNTPGQTWMTSVKAFQQDRTQPLVITFNGVSTNQEAVGELLLRLEAADQLEHATLKYTQPKYSDAGKQTEFEIIADLVGSKQETEEAKEKPSA